MEMLERYLYVVTHRLPEGQRQDVARELRATIEDTAADLSRGKPANESHIAAALEQLGDPQLLAGRYRGGGLYLIGPAWYDTYIKILKRVLFVALPAIAVITLVVQLSTDPAGVVNAFVRAIAGAVDVGLQVLFWVTVVFAALEHAEPHPQAAARPRAWTVDQLPKMPGPRQIGYSEALTDIVTDLTAAGLIAVPFLAAWLRGDADFVPLLNPALWQGWIPVFLILLALSLVHDIFKLRTGNWTPALTVTNVILGAASIAFLAALVLTQEVINPAHVASTAIGTVPEEARESARWGVLITVGCIILAYLYSIVNSIVLSRRLWKANP